MKWTRTFLIVLVLSMAVGTYASNGEDVLLEMVSSFLERGEPKKALKLLNSRLDTDPENLMLLSKRAEVFVLMAKEREAYKELRAILAKDSQFCPALLTTAQLKVRVDEVDSALWYIDKALAYEPNEDLTESLYGLKGNILMTRNEFKEAEDCLVKAASSNHVSLNTMRDLAAVMSENGKNDEAVMVLEQTIELFGVQMEPLINAGFVCNKMGRYDEAISYLDLALTLDSDNPYALANLADAYLQIGGLDMAFKKIERSINNDGTNAYAYKIKGDCLMKMGDPNRACREYRRAIENGYAVLFNQTEITKLMVESCGRE